MALLLSLSCCPLCPLDLPPLPEPSQGICPRVKMKFSVCVLVCGTRRAFLRRSGLRGAVRNQEMDPPTSWIMLKGPRSPVWTAAWTEDRMNEVKAGESCPCAGEISRASVGMNRLTAGNGRGEGYDPMLSISPAVLTLTQVSTR